MSRWGTASYVASTCTGQIYVARRVPASHLYCLSWAADVTGGPRPRFTRNKFPVSIRGNLTILQRRFTFLVSPAQNSAIFSGGRMRRYLLIFSLAVVWLAGISSAQDVASFEKRVTVKVLKNGLTVLLCPRSEAPVFSFFTIVDAGDAQDPTGQSGLAHMFEHMAFKGTDRIGTTNYAKEKIALDNVEKAYAAYDQEDRKEIGRDPKKVEELKAAFEKAVEDAHQYVIQNRFGEIIEREGGVGLNASTSMDSTQYFYSMPVNRFELWAYLESERLR